MTGTTEQVRPVTGGLVTKAPPTLLAGNSTPDALNVIARDIVLKSRGGFVPLFKDRMPGDCIANQGFLTTARESILSSDNCDFVVSPGCLFAGHRPIYNDAGGLTVALWVSPTKFYGQVGGNGQSGTAAPYDPAPYTVRVCPIISKGPVKQGEPTGTVQTANDWGTASTSGLPFCLYFFNSGTGSAPVWELRLSANVKIGGNWTIQTVTASVSPAEGRRYHVLFAVSGSRLALRVGEYWADNGGTIEYHEQETTFSGTLADNLCPIQVFDCPMWFVKGATGASATLRPGLGYSSAASGGPWFAKLRPDARIEDISIWSGDLNLETLERVDHVAWTGQQDLISLWGMRGFADDYVLEETGRGNHLFFVPRGPVSVPDDGGKEGGSWFFNGRTSYAMVDCDTPAWRWFDDGSATNTPATMSTIVRDNMAHGIAVEFWVDAIEPLYDSVVAEIHSVMRIVLTPSGNLRVDVRDGTVSAAATTAQQVGLNYQVGPTSTSVLVPGRRYHVAAMRRNGGATVDLYIDQVLEVSAAGLNPSNYAVSASAGNSYAISGITLGMGSEERMLRAPTLDDATMAGVNQINTALLSGFVGRIETFRVLVGTEAATQIERHGPEDADSWRFPEQRLWTNPMAADRTRLQPYDPGDTCRGTGRGSAAIIATQSNSGAKVPFAVSTGTPTAYYQLHDGTLENDAARGIEGHASVVGVGARLFFVFAYFRFVETDGRSEYSGSFWRGLEYRYVTAGAVTPLVADQQPHPYKHTHVQFSSVADAVGLLGAVERRCSEPDLQNDLQAAMGTFTSEWLTARQRPYSVRCPLEVGPRWAPGFVRATLGTTPVTMLADYSAQEADRRLILTGAGRSLYWAKPQWQDGRLAFAGGIDSYVFARTNSAADLNVTGAASKSTVVLSMWLRPTRLDGQRIIAWKGPAGGGGLYNWMVWADNGAIVVEGAEDAGPALWQFVQGDATAGDADVRRHNSLRVGVWNHLHVTIGGAGVQVRVNGQLLSMFDANGLTGANQSDAWGSGDSIVPLGGEFYLGGVPGGYEAYTAVMFDRSMQSWHGSIADVQVRTSVDSTRWPSGKDGFPLPMGTLDAGAVYALPLDEGAGWLCRNSVAPGYDAECRIREFIPIASGMRIASGAKWRSVAVRDRVIVTNGADDPMQIRFLGEDVANPWLVFRVGMAAPVLVAAAVTATTTAGTGVPAGTYLVQVAFVNGDGLESETVMLGTYELAADVATLELHLWGIPRSPDPQVVARRIYVSPIGGGEALFNRDVYDNDSLDVTVEVYDAAGVGPTPGNQLPAPRGKHLAVAGHALVVGDLTDIPAGRNAISVSRTDEVTQFTTSSSVVIDSEDGKPLIGIAHNQQQVLLSKKDQIHILAVGAITALQVDASIRLQQNSDGIGGGTAGANNMLYGAGDRGVFAFNNSELQYLTANIETTWRNEVDRSPDGLYAMEGAFLRPWSQYWLSVRRMDATENDTIFVLDLESNSWWRQVVFGHTTMRIIESIGDAPCVAIGTNDGRVLYYDDSTKIDGADLEALRNGAATITASTGLSGDSSHVVIASGNLSTVLAGLEGANVLVTHDGVSEVKRVAYHSGDTIYWDSPIEGFASYTSIAVGAYESYWTTAWFPAGRAGKPVSVYDAQFEFVPHAGNVQVDFATIARDWTPEAAWPTAANRSESFTVDMTTGYSVRGPQPKDHARGIYQRMRIGTYGVNDPWQLVGYSFRREESAAGHTAGRLS